jgi:hypothetical protein
MEEMSFLLFNKEVDIAVDHVGKLNQEKPVAGRVQGFDRTKTELERTGAWLRGLEKWRRAVGKLEGSDWSEGEGEGGKGDVEERGNKFLKGGTQYTTREPNRSKTEKLISSNGKELS